jgi:hypothetical protein
MTNHPEKLQRKVDAYLMELRRCLGELPAEEVNDILREIRSHILEKAEASGELSEERLVAILKALGRPEEIAPLYQADSIMTRARTSLSPAVVLRGMLRWAMISVRGFAIFLAGLIGYGLGVGFVLAAYPVWVDMRSVFDATGKIDRTLLDNTTVDLINEVQAGHNSQWPEVNGCLHLPQMVVDMAPDYPLTCPRSVVQLT